MQMRAVHFRLFALLASLIPGFGLGCLAASASITSTSGKVLYVDSSSNVSPGLLGNYVGYTVTNDSGSDIADAWVTAGSFTGSYVSLGLHEPGRVHVGPLANGASATIFFYLNVDCSSFSAGACNVTTAQPFSVNLYSGPPTANLVASQAFSVTVQETTKALANKVTTVTTSSNDPILGSIITVTVTGSTGTIGSAKLFYASPQTTFDFSADVFRLYSTSVTFSGANTGTYSDQLLIPTAAFSSTADTSYVFVSTYLVGGMTAVSTPVSPVAFISSGTQIKHTDTSGYASLPPIPPTSNTTTIQKLASVSVLPNGGPVTYTLQAQNAGSAAVTLDSFVDTLPAGVSYVPGTSTLNGSSIADPAASGGSLTWSNLFIVPANSSVSLAFQAIVPNSPGVYTNSATGFIGTTQLDSSLSTSDNSPATATVVVGTTALSVSSTHAGSFTQGQTGAVYTLTVSDSGTGPTVGTVTVSDTLPSGLTATAISGLGWTCSLPTLTCTRMDTLAGGSSYPAISVTVNVASNAPATVTNSVIASGGGATSNATATDSTTITQLPVLAVSSTHSGNFTQGQTGATYSLIVADTGSGPTNGTVTVTDTLPAGLTATAIGGSGWSCVLATLTCTRADVLTGGGSYSPITVTVNVDNNAAATVTNSVIASGGGATNSASTTDSTTITQLPVLSVTSTHSGNFTQGQTGATYTLTVKDSGSGPTNGTVTVVDTLPAGLTATAMVGSGWTCVLATLTCTRADVLAAGSSYPAIALTVNVAGNAPATVTNSVTAAGGGAINNATSTDSTSITQLPALAVSSTHAGNFTQGQTGATYTLTVSDSGSGATSGAVTVVDTLPAGLTATSISGSGWTCTLATLTCTRTDALSAGSSYPAITVTVNVANNAAASVTNSVTASGGGATSNATASDSTTIDKKTPAGTTTSLVITPSSPVNSGASVTLSATVLAGAVPVSQGVVNFCDATASSCNGSALFGSAQLNAGGMAAIHFVPGVGTYSVVASFAGTADATASQSAPEPLVVNGTGGYQTKTAISITGGSGLYALTGTVTAFGKPVPTGAVSFLDSANGNAVTAPADLDANTLAFTTFAVKNQPAVSGLPMWMTVGDFNNDGNSDLVIPSGSSNSVSILLGNGDGTFKTAQTFVTEPSTTAYAAVVGDFNGDGNPDLAITNAQGTGSVSILLGNGDGTFQAQTSYPTGMNPSTLQSADVNGDGDADLIAINKDDNSVSLLLGNGDGTFQAQDVYATGSAPTGLAVADMNGDGVIDIMVANSVDNTLGLLLGNGDGTFAAQTTIPLSSTPAEIAVADVNGDGHTDIIVTHPSANSVGVLLGNGDGTFQPEQAVAANTDPVAVASADFDGDGHLDLAVSNNADNSVSVLLGKGDGTFQPAVAFEAGAQPYGVQAADLNGDGLPDIASIGNTFTGALTVLLSEHVESATANSVSLTPGTHNVLASYPGDVSHMASQSDPVALAGGALASTATTLSASANQITVGQSVTLSAVVSPAPTGAPLGTISFYNGSSLLGTGNLDATGGATIAPNNLSAGTYSVSAVYSGNTAFSGSTSNTVSITVQAPSQYTVKAPQTPFIVKGGNSIDVPVTAPPVGGAYNNNVVMSATGLPPGATVSFNPASVVPGSAGAATTMSIHTAALAAKSNDTPLFPYSRTTIALGLCFVFVRRRHLKKPGLGLVMLVMLGLPLLFSATGCGGGFHGKVRQPQTYVITITGTSGSLHPSTTVTLVVQ
ncbi:MAG TPA: FG-GAP-like repeat-containing protein [Terracidiphilus sp.]|nr:FG-GAP-like repeat-containing protein [Terracidiphilus sp.]